VRDLRRFCGEGGAGCPGDVLVGMSRFRAKRILVALSLLLTAVLSGVAAEAVTDPAEWERPFICGPVDPVHGHRHICYDTPRGIPWACGSQMEPVICYDRPGDD
jgi:hypothetical protein